MSKKKKNLIPLVEFADKRGFSYHSSRRWVQEGRIKGSEIIKVGNTTVYLVPEEAIETFQRPKRGRPKRL